MAETTTGPQSPDVLLRNWVGALGTVDPPAPNAAPEQQPPQPSKEPDGKTDAPSANNDAGVGKPTAAPAPNPAPADNPPAQKPEPETKPAAETAEEKWPRTAQEWKKFKEARKQAIEERETAITSLKSELEELRKRASDAPQSSPELDTLKKERDELSDRLRTVDVERHPKFKAYFDSKTQAQVELAKRIVGKEQADVAARLVALPEGDYKTAQIEELMVNLTPLQQSRFGSVLNAMAEIEAERQGEIAKGRENYDRMLSEQKSAQETRMKSIEKAFTDAALKAQDAKEGRVVFQKREGDHEWNKQVEQRLEYARNIFFGKNVRQEQVISAALDAAALPAVLSGYEALHAENETLKQQVAELSKAAPVLASSEHPTDGTPQSVPIRVGARPDEVMRGWVKSLTSE